MPVTWYIYLNINQLILFCFFYIYMCFCASMYDRACMRICFSVVWFFLSVSLCLWVHVCLSLNVTICFCLQSRLCASLYVCFMYGLTYLSVCDVCVLTCISTTGREYLPSQNSLLNLSLISYKYLRFWKPIHSFLSQSIPFIHHSVAIEVFSFCWT